MDTDGDVHAMGQVFGSTTNISEELELAIARLDDLESRTNFNVSAYDQANSNLTEKIARDGSVIYTANQGYGGFGPTNMGYLVFSTNATAPDAVTNAAILFVKDEILDFVYGAGAIAHTGRLEFTP